MVVKRGIYQLPLSEGLAESHRSAVHQHAALLSHLTVAALGPARRGGGQSHQSERTPASQDESQPSHPPDAGVQLSRQVGVKVVAQHSVFAVQLR